MEVPGLPNFIYFMVIPLNVNFIASTPKEFIENTDTDSRSTQFVYPSQSSSLNLGTKSNWYLCDDPFNWSVNHIRDILHLSQAKNESSMIEL